MKLSAIVVSVNLAATIPVAAQAAEHQMMTTSDWLKESLSQIERQKAHPACHPSKRKISLSDPGPLTRSVRLRPFMPNRPLPTRAELERAESARLDTGIEDLYPTNPRSKTELTGRAYLGKTPCLNSPGLYGSMDRYSAGNAGQIKCGPVARNSPCLPGQVQRGALLASSPASIPEPPASTSDETMRFNPAGASSNAIPEPLSSLAPHLGERLVQPPTLTRDQEAMLDALVDLSRPDKDAGQDGTYNNSQLGRLMIRQASARIKAPPCYFGSWHQSTLANTSAQAHLSPASFHSFISHKPLYGRSLSHYTSSQAQTLRPTTSNRPGCRSVQLTASRETGHPVRSSDPVDQATIAVYPPYRGQSRVYLF